MSLIFETVQTKGIAALSYLIGDDQTGEAAVIDPRADVDLYVELAQKHKVSITHIFETHIHADLVSGARELSARVKTAKVFLSAEGEAEYGFDHEAMRDGAEFEFGTLILKASIHRDTRWSICRLPRQKQNALKHLGAYLPVIRFS